MTRIYDQEEEERIFGDIECEEVGATQVLDDNRFQLADDQQERAAEDAFDLVLKDQRGSGGFTAAELGEESETKRARTSGAFATPQKANNDEEPPELAKSSSDDGLSPAERAQQAEVLKQSGTRKAKAKPKSSPHKSQSNTGLSLGGGGGSVGAGVTQMFKCLCKRSTRSCRRSQHARHWQRSKRRRSQVSFRDSVRRTKHWATK